MSASELSDIGNDDDDECSQLYASGIHQPKAGYSSSIQNKNEGWSGWSIAFKILLSFAAVMMIIYCFAGTYEIYINHSNMVSGGYINGRSRQTEKRMVADSGCTVYEILTIKHIVYLYADSETVNSNNNDIVAIRAFAEKYLTEDFSRMAYMTDPPLEFVSREDYIANFTKTLKRGHMTIHGFLSGGYVECDENGAVFIAPSGDNVRNPDQNLMYQTRATITLIRDDTWKISSYILDPAFLFGTFDGTGVSI